jgi:hypothetical protein
MSASAEEVLTYMNASAEEAGDIYERVGRRGSDISERVGRNSAPSTAKRQSAIAQYLPAAPINSILLRTSAVIEVYCFLLGSTPKHMKSMFLF